MKARKLMFLKLIVYLVWIALGTASGTRVLAQNYNPSFPRVMFGRPAAAVGGAIDQFYARFDLAIIGGAGLNEARCAESVRKINPDCIIIGTSRQGVWPDNDPPDSFVFSNAFATLTQPANPGNTDIYLTNTRDFPSDGKQYALIGGDDWIRYAGVTDNSLTGVTGLDRTHTKGEQVQLPIRFVGFGMLHNLTRFAPPVNGKPVHEYFIDKRFTQQDFSKFDGIFYDAFRLAFYEEDFSMGLDLDNNHVSDLEEHGINWLNNLWEEGIKKSLDYEHQKFSRLHPGKPSIIILNTGSVELGYGLDYCEGMMWEGFMRFASTWEEMLNVNREWEQRHNPVYTQIEDYDNERRREYGKNKFDYMRFGLTTALMAGAFYGRTFGDYYYITYYYDEFDTDLGLPASEPQRMPTGAYARFFDKGVAICNPTGTPIVVTNAELAGLNGYQGPYYRFKGGQVPQFNNGELFTFVNLFGETRDKPRYNQGDGILLFKKPVTVVADIMVGNTFNNDTNPGSEKVKLVGSWKEEMDPNGTFPPQNPCYSQWNEDEDGIGYAFTLAGNGNTTATFAPTIGVPGYYEILEWHGWVGDSPDEFREASNVPFEIVVNGVTKIMGTIDQSTSAGQWNRVAIVELPAGTNSFIRINNKANGYVIADAMQFHYLGTDVKADLNPPQKPQNVTIQYKSGN